MRIGVVLAALVAAGGPAAAFPEGRFASADGATELRIARPEPTVIELAVASPAIAGRVEARLARSADRPVWEQEAETAGWMSRLMGSGAPTAMPFDGGRLVFAREEGRELVVTALEVGDGGRPTMLRIAVVPAGDGAEVSLRRFDGEGLYATEPTRLEPVAR